MKYILIISVLVLTGCDVRFDRLMKGMFGVKSQEVVLVKDALIIDTKPKIIRTAEPLRVLGKEAMLCLVLGSGYDLKQQSEMNELFRSSTADTGVSATYIDANKRTYTLTEPSQSWTLYGVIKESKEVSACFTCDCGNPKPAVGTEFSQVILKSVKPVKVLGVYWSSESDLSVSAKN